MTEDHPDRQKIEERPNTKIQLKAQTKGTSGQFRSLLTTPVHPSVIVTLLGIIFIVIFGVDFTRLRDDIREVEDSKRKIEEFQAEINLHYDNLRDLRELATVEYPEFYSTFLQLQIWSIVQEFSINCDTKSIGKIKMILGVISPFFRRPHQNESIRPLAQVIKYISSIINQQIEINRLHGFRQRKAQLEETQPSAKSMFRKYIRAFEDSIAIFESSILDNLENIARKTHPDPKVPTQYPKLMAWIAGTAHLLMYRHGLDPARGRLVDAEDAFTSGLRVVGIKDSPIEIWDSELRTSIAMVNAALGTKEKTSIGQIRRLIIAIDRLRENTNKLEDWDVSIYNNLADYRARWFTTIILESAKTRQESVFETRRDSLRQMLLNAEADSRRAVMRDLGEPTYYVTLFEITCLKYAVWDSLGFAPSLRTSQRELELLLRDVFGLTYERFYHKYLFGIRRDDEPLSKMMLILRNWERPVFDSLSMRANEFIEQYCNWNDPLKNDL